MWPVIASILPDLLDRVLPDPAQANEAKLRVLELAQKGELAAMDADMRLALGQMEINKVEAGTDIYRGGWRPGAGWVCVFGLAYTFLLRPLLPWFAALAGADVPELPPIETGELMILLGGLLGLGGFRSAERIKGKA